MILGYLRHWELKKLENDPSPDTPVEHELTRLQDRISALELEQVRLKQDLEASCWETTQYLNLIMGADDIIYETDAAGHFIFFNPVSERITGYSKEELTGRHYLDLIHPDYRAEASRVYGKQFSYKISDTYFEFPLVTKDNREVWLGQHVQLRMKEDELVGFQAIARDITKQKQSAVALKEYQEQLETMVEQRTFELKKKNVTLEHKIFERKQAEAALRESEERYRTILETIEDGYYECDLAGNLTFFNEAMVRIHEHPKAELLGMNNQKFTDTRNAKKMFRDYGQVYLTGKPCKGIEFEIITESGGKKAIENSISLIRDSAGKPVGFRGICRDITELKRAQAALKESEERYRTIIETIEDGYYESNLAGRLTFFNDALARLHEFSREEFIGMHSRDYTDARNAQLLQQEFNRVYQTGRPLKGLQYEFTTKTGKRKQNEISVSLMRDSSGEPAGFRGICRDISERKQAELALQKTHAKIALLLNSISSILVALSDENRIIFWNTKAEEQFGLLEKEVLGKPLGDLGIHWDSNQIETSIARCRKENTLVGLDNLKFLQTDGKEGILGLRITPLFGEDFSDVGILIQGANITRRKILESQLTQAQKLESIGQLAAGIAHEINTPTQYVGDNIRFLQTSFEDLTHIIRKYGALKEGVRKGEALDGFLNEVEEAIQGADLGYLTEEIPKAFQQTLEGLERVSRIVQSMKAFAHPGKEEKVAVDINKAIENTMVVARNEWKYVADLITDLDPSLPFIPCIPGDINQVILNVLVNAAQAVSEAVGDGSNGKGKISISTRRDEPWVEIRISDTGKGIPPEIQSKIFDPFFTTKEVGKGTGQGLAISHTAVVERHQGSITVESERGQGATFKIRLPIKDSVDARG